MNGGTLKKIRVAVSLLFLLFTGFLFIDFRNLVPSAFRDTAVWLQFMPSLVQFLHVFSFAAAGFLVVLLLTMIFGRVYCSTVCPLGALQDVITRISVSSRHRRRFRFHKANNILRYVLLAVTLGAFLAGSLLFINLLDPFSNFGKIIANLARPVVMLVNNGVSFLLEHFRSYLIPPVAFKGFHFLPVTFAFIFLALLVVMASRRGRLFCNTICPVGSLLGLFSYKSLLHFSLNEELCNSCGVCSASCKAECIDSKNRKVDMTRCVGCFNCLSVCKTNGVTYHIRNKGKKLLKPAETDLKRRYLITGILTTTAALTALKGLTQVQDDQPQRPKKKYKAPIPVNRKYPVSPPGSQSLYHFTASCTACHLCITACPTQVLVPAFTEYGLTGIMQPRMNYLISFCNFECTLCSQVCPTGAILPVVSEQKKEIQVGMVHFVKDNCVVITEKTDCGACAEHCPTKAVKMVLQPDGLFLPEITPAICVGCGACEYACPTDPKAIYVEGNPVHQKAEKPIITEIERKDEPTEDFPF